MKFNFFIALFFLMSFQSSALEASTEHNSKSEIETIELINALRKAHDLEKWEFTNKIHINKKSIPHSHPVLTLHTRHTSKKQKDMLLSTYLHEQIHWYLDNNLDQTNAAIADLQKIFKNAPVGYPTGARNEKSTYLHLIVCYMELEAISSLLSKQRFEKVKQFWLTDHYTWIYKQVTENGAKIKSIINRHKLTIV